jgi:hypothetical protein
MAAGKQSTRNASLNDAKERGAGRQNTNPQLNAALDPDNTEPMKGETAGAFGKEGQASHNPAHSGGGGGGPLSLPGEVTPTPDVGKKK